MFIISFMIIDLLDFKMGDGPTKSDITQIFKRLKAASPNKV